MRNYLYSFLFVLINNCYFGQLLPSIGLNSVPQGTALICNEPFYLGNYYSTGYQQGNTVPNFKLYDLNGDSLVLSDALSDNKPVLLISGSLTCPVFRAKVPIINQIATTYSSNIKVYVIYTLEAHPTDTSVYFGYVNITSQNTVAGILFPSPNTYSQRKDLVDTMSYYVSLNAPVFIDGPCNNWWKNFGPAPNNSYLISPTGVVLNKHGWFHKSPDNIFCDLDSILNINSGLCIPPPTIPGNFTITVVSNNVTGNPTDLLYDYVDVINTSSVVVTYKAKKIIKSLPLGWQTAFCADVCYSTAEDSIIVSLAPFETMHISFDFFTDNIPDSGSVKVGFKNMDKPNNSFSVRLRASTLPIDVGLINLENEKSVLEIYPNPSSNQFVIQIYPEITKGEFILFNSAGQKVFEQKIIQGANEVNINGLARGFYNYILQNDKQKIKNGKIVLN